MHRALPLLLVGILTTFLMGATPPASQPVEDVGPLFVHLRDADKPPKELMVAYAVFLAATRNPDAGTLTTHCLPHAISVTHEPRLRASVEYGQDMNLPFLRDRFDGAVQSVRKDPDDCYLIRPATTALWFVQTRSGQWKIYRYLDKPIL